MKWSCISTRHKRHLTSIRNYISYNFLFVYEISVMLESNCMDFQKNCTNFYQRSGISKNQIASIESAKFIIYVSHPDVESIT